MQNKYLQFARFYPTISAMAIPAVVATTMCVEAGSIPDTAWSMAVKLLTFAPIAGIFVALGFWFTEIARFLSLIIMEKTRFKSSGRNMPTTKILMGLRPNVSQSLRIKLSEKLFSESGIELPKVGSIDDESMNICINATGFMREKTRDNVILIQYNYDFGFCRNYIGGSVVAVIILLLLLSVAIFYHFTLWWSIGGLLLQSIMTWFFWRALCIAGDQYANHLIYAYISK